MRTPRRFQAAPLRQGPAAENQRGKPRRTFEVRCDFLVERDAVMDIARLHVVWVDAGHQSDFGEVGIGMEVRHARKHGEVLAVRLQDLQVAARLVVLPRLFGEEIGSVQAEERPIRTIRLIGFLALASAAPAGSIASRNGSPMATPAERRKVLRSSRLNGMVGSRRLVTRTSPQ